MKNKSAYVKTWRVKFRRLIYSLKDAPCLDCGKKYPPYVMQFDHRIPSKKEFNISRVLSSPVSMERLMAELDKCDLVCANCHAERSHQRRDNVV